MAGAAPDGGVPRAARGQEGFAGSVSDGDAVVRLLPRIWQD